MKSKSLPQPLRACAVVAVFAFLVHSGHAAAIAWTNTSGGNWSASGNWSPNQVPGSTDDAIITTNGIYTVTLDISTSVGSMILGGASGQQIFNTDGDNLGLNNASVINSNGNLELNGGSVSAALLTVNGNLTWTSGSLGGNVMVATNGALTLEGVNGNNCYISGTLTNAGTVRLQNGNIYLYACNGNQGLMVNLPGGLVNFEESGSINNQGCDELFINQGTLRSSGGGTATIYPTFNNLGVLDAQNGNVSLNGGGTLDGSITPETGGVVYLNGGGYNGVISGNLLWVNGSLGNVTVATNGVLTLEGVNGNNYYIYWALTNAGTVRVQNGNLYLYGCNGNQGLMVNLPGGVVNFEESGSINNQGCDELFINQGTLRSSGGGTATIYPTFNNLGVLDAQNGNVSLNGGGTLDGSITPENGGVVYLNGGGYNGVISGDLAWVNGSLGNVTVATNSMLTLEGDNGNNYYIYGTLTNAGTVRLQNGNLYLYGCNGNQGLLVNLPGGLLNFEGNNSINNQGCGESVINQGTVLKSNGGTSIVYPFLDNAGTLNSQSGLLNLTGGVNLTDGTLNFGINNPSSFGEISISGYAGLTGAVSANFNNGYVPVGSNSFTVLTYGSEGGVFANLSLPSGPVWQASYGPTAFTLSESNVTGTLTFAAISNQTVNELATLIVTNSATDPNVPPEVLTFALISAPSGMTINPTNGLITWTPSQSQSPSTNAVTVIVSDNGTPPLSATNSVSVIVKEVNIAPSLPLISTQVVNELSLLTVTNAATEPNIHATTTGYSLVNPLAGMSINSNGVISWTPGQTQSPGTNVIITVVTNIDSFDAVNPQRTATNSFEVIVWEVNVTPVLPDIAAQNVADLTLLTVTNTATEANIHAMLAYALVAAPPGAGISTNGIITWTPSAAQNSTTNTIMTVATSNDPFDYRNPALSATNSFTVIVRPGLMLTAPIWNANGEFQFSFNATAGRTYTVQSSTDLTNWISILAIEGSDGPLMIVDPDAAASSQGSYYRVKVGGQ